MDGNASSVMCIRFSFRRQVLRRCVGQQLPLAQKQQIAAAVGLVHYVAGHQQRGATPRQRILNRSHDAQYRIQAGGRLVELADQAGRLAHTPARPGPAGRRMS